VGSCAGLMNTDGRQNVPYIPVTELVTITEQFTIYIQNAEPTVSKQCVTVADRAFATAGARLWNSLPTGIVACDTLPQFHRELKTFLFRQS